MDGIIEGLIAAWILSLFRVELIFIDVIQDFVKFEITTSHYYFIFAVIGLICELARR